MSSPNQQKHATELPGELFVLIRRLSFHFSQFLCPTNHHLLATTTSTHNYYKSLSPIHRSCTMRHVRVSYLCLPIRMGISCLARLRFDLGQLSTIAIGQQVVGRFKRIGLLQAWLQKVSRAHALRNECAVVVSWQIQTTFTVATTD